VYQVLIAYEVSDSGDAVLLSAVVDSVSASNARLSARECRDATLLINRCLDQGPLTHVWQEVANKIENHRVGLLNELVDLHTQSAATILAVAQRRAQPDDTIEVLMDGAWVPCGKPSRAHAFMASNLASNHYRFRPKASEKELRAHSKASFEAWLGDKVLGNVVFRCPEDPAVTGWGILASVTTDGVFISGFGSFGWDTLLLAKWEVSGNGLSGPWEPVAVVEP